MHNVAWLERLNRATDYRELQETFAEIVAHAQAGGDHAELARCIDEAIRRLEAERARDEQELAEVQARYDSFRDENKSVMGWFKRHMPFTESHRQEHEHHGNVAQQKAEILADNLVIARAQMLKESFLPAANRKLGQRPAAWRSSLESAAADRQLARPAEVLQSLAVDIDRSHAFLAAVKHDIDAFAHAEFKSAEDRQRRDSDLAAARHERAELSREVAEKEALKQAGLKQLLVRAKAELELSDAVFRADGQQLGRLGATLAHVNEAHVSLAKLVEAAIPLGALSKALKELPAQTQQLNDSLGQLENHSADANAVLSRKLALRDEQQGRVDAAQRDLDQAQQLLAGEMESFRARQAESRPPKTMPTPVEDEVETVIQAASPELRKITDAQASFDSARACLRNAVSRFESAKKEADAAQAAHQETKKQLDAMREAVAAQQRKAPQLRVELAAAIDRARVAFAAAASALGAYLAGDRVASVPPFPPQELAAGMWNCLGQQGLERGLVEALVQAEPDYQRHLQAAQVLDRLGKWLEVQRQAIEQERATTSQRRDAAWHRRCSELLGEPLAKEACAAGLPG